MSELGIALSVCAGLVGIMGLTFTVFWNIILGTKNDINKRIETIFEERNAIMTQINMKFSSLDKEMGERMPYTYGENTFQRKDTHQLQMQSVLLAIGELRISLESFIEESRQWRKTIKHE